MYKTKSYTSTNTQILTYAKKKAKESLYLVLKKKPFATEIVEEINEEVEKRLTKFVEKLAKNLEEWQSEDKEKLLKFTLLKAIVKILDNIMQENYIKMTENDKIAVEKIFGNGDDDDIYNFKNERNNYFKNNHFQDKSPYNAYDPKLNNNYFNQRRSKY